MTFNPFDQRYARIVTAADVFTQGRPEVNDAWHELCDALEDLSEAELVIVADYGREGEPEAA